LYINLGSVVGMIDGISSGLTSGIAMVSKTIKKYIAGCADEDYLNDYGRRRRINYFYNRISRNRYLG
jgi:hypothetical protein